MTEFMYNNAKNTSIYHTLFMLNYNFYPYIFFENNISFYSKFYLANKLAK